MLADLETKFAEFLRSRGLNPEYKDIGGGKRIVYAWCERGEIQCHVDRNRPALRRVDRVFYSTAAPENVLRAVAKYVTQTVNWIDACAYDDTVVLSFETVLDSPMSLASPEELAIIVDAMERVWLPIAAIIATEVAAYEFITKLENDLRQRFQAG